MTNRVRYRKAANAQVTAIKLDLKITQFNYHKWNCEQSCSQGDWLIHNNGDTYTVADDFFKEYYKEVSPGRYVKDGEIWAENAFEDGQIVTQECKSNFRKGDYLVFDRPSGGTCYVINKYKFESMYEPVESAERTQSQNEYVERLDEQIAWYNRQATNSKYYFFTFQTIAIVSAAAVPIISVVDLNNNLLLACLGGASALISGILSLFQFQANWIKFRSTCEDLKSHLAQYKAVAGVYAGRKNAFNTLVENCEQLISVERGHWAQSNSGSDSANPNV